MKKVLTALAIVVATFSLGASPAFAQKQAVYTKALSRVGVGGYDPVAYFTDGRAVRGDAAHGVTYQGYEYRFSSADHAAMFKADPARYLPQYGGYCAWAVSQGYTASADPKAWRVVGGKLYLNYNADIQRRWEKDVAGHISSANANWPKVLDK